MRRARERIRGRNSKINCRTVSAAAGTPSASGATSRRHASQRQVISGRMVRDDLFGGDVRRRVLKARQEFSQAGGVRYHCLRVGRLG